MTPRATVKHDDLKLCYIDGVWAWFTTLPIEDQWGDDWDDAPYELNAGDPYEYREGEKVFYQLFRVAFIGPFLTPSSDVFNSPFSVKQVNARHIAWLRPSGNHDVVIHAGELLPDFIKNVQKAGGTVYFPVEDIK